jgi:hypothetical protein
MNLRHLRGKGDRAKSPRGDLHQLLCVRCEGRHGDAELFICVRHQPRWSAISGPFQTKTACETF